MGKAEHIQSVRKYNEEKYHRIEIKPKKSDNLPKRLDEHCIKYGYLKEYGKIGEPNRSGFILKAIETQMKIDRGELKIVE